MPCYVEPAPDGGVMFVNGELGPHCCACARASELLCDFPVADGITCDRPLCSDHGEEVAPDLHYCPAHMQMWREFRDGGGVERELANVVPFSEKKGGE